MRKIEIYSKSGGNAGQYVDRWYLVQADDGTYQVEYYWVNKMGPGRKDVEGSNLYSLEEAYLRAPQEALEAINRELEI
ncbi:hypothetical protein BRY73_16185 [Ochrobactrum sp. P6BS-III]|uniref:hypothetical protein n=1 Tax=unclassified Ochrobactrum TaxID=239106 RepID=UPI00099486EF|nr:hypothetical protein [Ochrobactrum sp. P6BSIII]OOL16008.1 hypothetical protein BRY73_16185 [Ochrobactrum sp. P6BS-III]